jgi:hypothetical protein
LPRSTEDWDFLLNVIGQNRESGFYAKFCREPGCGGGNTGTVCWLCGNPFDRQSVAPQDDIW